MAEPSFHWSEFHKLLRAEVQQGSVVFDRERHVFETMARCIIPPLVFPSKPQSAAGDRQAPSAADLARLARERREGADGDELLSYLADLPEQLPLQCVILMQAGAVSLGMFEAGEVLATKTLKRYVVRGKGRAQPTHLRTKGKSRYGSRLRLQNAKLLFEEASEKLGDYFAEFGRPEHIFVGAPVRLWAEFFQVQPPPPFEASEPIVRIPLDLPVPTTEVLLRTYKAMCHGRVEPKS